MGETLLFQGCFSSLERAFPESPAPRQKRSRIAPVAPSLDSKRGNRSFFGRGEHSFIGVVDKDPFSGSRKDAPLDWKSNLPYPPLSGLLRNLTKGAR